MASKRVEERAKTPPAAPAKGGASTGAIQRGKPGVPKLELLETTGNEHRQFPRAKMAVVFKCWIGDAPDLRFSASLASSNLSVSGAFLESTFFLPIGTEIRVSFAIEEGEAPVEARAQIVREERPDEGGRGRSGVGLKFVEFFGQTEVTLAKLFLGEQLRGFAADYLGSKRARSLTSELDRVVDALAAWELLKVTTPGDPWRPKTGD